MSFVVRWRAALAVACLAARSEAQVVRGAVTEAVTGRPLPGVLVELMRVSAGGLDSLSEGAVLAGERGTFAVRARTGGGFVLSAKRIGVRRFRSALFPLAAGETVVRNVVVDPVGVTLPEIVIAGFATCVADDAGRARITQIWDDVRTALLATQLSLRDSLFTARVSRYVRELEPRTRRVLSETRSTSRGVVAQPFLAVDPESLSALGYLRANPDGGTTYFGLDAKVILSDAFVRDHCFTEVRGGRARPGLTGLGFRPVRDVGVVNVVGTLWVDMASSELRYVDFGYRGLPANTDTTDVTGQVHFARLASGAWTVRRWFLRLPIRAHSAPPLSTSPGGASWVLVRPTTLKLREEGGEVTVVRP